MLRGVWREPLVIFRIFAGLVFFCVGCAGLKTHVEEPCWDAQPTVIEGEIFVLPPLVAVEAPDLNLTGYLGEELQYGWTAGRIHRTSQIAELPYALSDALPGHLHSAFPANWNGRFRPASLDSRRHRRLVTAAMQNNHLSPLLSKTAQELGGGGCLFVWITSMNSEAFTESTMSGEMIFLQDLPVLVDRNNEPYKVEIGLGVALFDGDGVLAFRYSDEYETLLSSTQGLHHAAHNVAEKLVADLRLIWPQRPDLYTSRLVRQENGKH